MTSLAAPGGPLLSTGPQPVVRPARTSTPAGRSAVRLIRPLAALGVLAACAATTAGSTLPAAPPEGAMTADAAPGPIEPVVPGAQQPAVPQSAVPQPAVPQPAAEPAPGTAAADSPAGATPGAAATQPEDAGQPPASGSGGGRSLLPRTPGGKAAAGAGAALVVGGGVAAGVVIAGGGDATPEDFGAKGDGRTDDTAALQKALDSLSDGKVLRLRSGATYLHSDVLTVRRAGVTITGTGAILQATREARSAFAVTADRVTVTGLTLTTPSTTKRWDAYEQHKVRIAGNADVLRNVTVRGSAAAGVFVGNGAGNFLLDHVTVSDARADGIHLTDGAHDGRVVSPVTANTGDDGVAVVSYQRDGRVAHDITISSPTVNGTTHGRGISVVGGRNVTYTNISVHDTDAAGVYLGSEGDPYFTYGSTNVLVDGGTVTGANTNASVEHGAVLVYAGSPGTSTSAVTVRNLAISGTRSSAAWDVGLITDGGATATGVSFSGLSVRSGARSLFWTNTPTAVARQDVTRAA